MLPFKIAFVINPRRRLCLEHRPVELYTDPESKSDSRACHMSSAPKSSAIQPRIYTLEPFNFGKPNIIVLRDSQVPPA